MNIRSSTCEERSDESSASEPSSDYRFTEVKIEATDSNETNES